MQRIYKAAPSDKIDLSLYGREETEAICLRLVNSVPPCLRELPARRHCIVAGGREKPFFIEF